MSYLVNGRHEDAGALFGMYRGATCFLLCGGPSLRTMDLEPLKARGVLVAAVNNAATVFRPHLWFSFDAAARFSETIWADPGIMKFTREDRLEMRITKYDPGVQQFMQDEKVQNCPNVFGYKCEHTWKADAFLTSQLPTGGTDNERDDPDGERIHKSVMLPALRILFDLGVRRLYLLGADFFMDEAAPYGFDEEVRSDRVERNNLLFGWLDRRFHELQPVFGRAKYKIWNATPGTRLTAFERVDYTEVVKRESSRVDQHPVTKGQYQL